MMGEGRVAQEALFYEFNLERHIPADHLLRAIDCVIDLSGLRVRSEIHEARANRRVRSMTEAA